MGYGLGVDLGTTWTAAALVRDGGQPEMVALGGRTVVAPTVVFLAEDGTLVVGEAAVRRALAEPERAAREAKRRIGDTVPVLLAGSPYSPESLLAAVLAWVVARATEVEGGPPDQVVVTHPANWGALRRELLEQAVAHLGVRARFLSEPEAAAAHYAAATRVPEGAVVAVYDLGGGTFDATVLRKSAGGFEVLGRPQGVDRLGGLDFDAAVLAHVTAALGPAWTSLDPEEPATRSAVARLREACVEAKEALSEDPDAAVPVALPSITTDVRLTRGELEAKIRPAIEHSADALAQAIDAAGVGVGEVDRILLVGGSSRIPLVSQVLAARFGRPLAVDAHPKHAVALGAARAAATPAVAAPAWPSTSPPPAPSAPAAPPPPTPPPTPPLSPAPPTAGARRATWWVAAAVVVVLGIVGALTLGGGDDPAASGPSTENPAVDGDASGAAGTGSTTEPTAQPTTTAADRPDGEIVGQVAQLLGGGMLQANLASCEPATCIPGTEALNVELGNLPCVDAADGGEACSLAFDGSDVAPLEVVGDEVVAGGPAAIGRGLTCEASGQIQPTTWELRLPVPDPGDEIDDLAATLTLASEAVEGGCEASARTYEVTFDRSDRYAPLLEGEWRLDGTATSCTGLGEADCARLQAGASFALEITCESSCSAAIDGSEAGVLFPAGLLLEALGTLPADSGFVCDGQPDLTEWKLFVELATLRGGPGDSWPATIRLESDAGGGLSCGLEQVELEVTASPA